MLLALWNHAGEDPGLPRTKQPISLGVILTLGVPRWQVARCFEFIEGLLSVAEMVKGNGFRCLPDRHSKMLAFSATTFEQACGVFPKRTIEHRLSSSIQPSIYENSVGGWITKASFVKWLVRYSNCPKNHSSWVI